MVVTLKMRGRVATFAVLLMIVALLPFLAGGAPAPSRQAMLLSGDTRAADSVVWAQDPHDSLAELDTPSWTTTSDPELQRALQSLAAASATGGGFAFPVIALTPLAMQTLSVNVATTAVDGMGFIHPVAGSVASHFGPRVHPVLGRAMFHTGIDLMAACGTPVRAAAAGRVVVAQTSNSWGNRIIIEHSPYLKTAYGHLSAFVAQEGDVVAQGEVIGLVGTTGWSTGCHLHWDVIINDQYVDPAPFLGMASTVHASVPYYPAPHVQPVQDGDVPVSEATQRPETATDTTTPGAPTSPVTKPTTGKPTGTATTPATPTDTPTDTPTETEPTDPATETEPGEDEPTETETEPGEDESTETPTEDPTETEPGDSEPTDEETDEPEPDATTGLDDEEAEITQPPDLGFSTGLRDDATTTAPGTSVGTTAATTTVAAPDQTTGRATTTKVTTTKATATTSASATLTATAKAVLTTAQSLVATTSAD